MQDLYVTLRVTSSPWLCV